MTISEALKELGHIPRSAVSPAVSVYSSCCLESRHVIRTS
jgi:hypothetical protein